jgi:hypothetical protein
VPFKDFSGFSAGMVSIELRQAYSRSESATNRTSNFSAPYTLTINASEHHFASNQKDNGIGPYRIQLKTNDRLIITGTSTDKLNNEVIITTPDYRFESILIDQSKSQSAQLESGTRIFLSIPFNLSGVYFV